MTDGSSQPTPEADAEARRLLSVDHLQSDIVPRSVRSGGVTLAAQAMKVLVQGAAIIVLARLLAPADFGLFAMVAAFLTLLELFKDLGLSTATVQRADLTLRQVSTLFWLNSALGLLVAALFALAAPLLAWGYGEERLLSITSVVAIAFVFTGLAAQHLALLRRQMRFAVVARTQVGAEIVSLVAAIAAAFGGMGVWALVVQRLVWAVAMAVGGWISCRWVPGAPGPIAEVRSFISFGGYATASMGVNYLSNSLDKVLIGWYWGAAPLGLYDRAQRVHLLPIQNLNIPLANVALATLSRLIDQPARYRQVYLAAVERIGMVISPLGGLLVAAAAPFVHLILGPQWAEAVPILTWMSAALAYLPVSYAVSWLFMSQDRTPEMLRAGLANSAVVIAAIAAGLPFGPVGVAAAYVVTGAMLRAPLMFWLVGRRGPVRTSDLWRAVLMPAVAGAAVAMVVWLARTWGGFARLDTGADAAISLLLAGITALLVYAAFPSGRHALVGLFRLRALLFDRHDKTVPSAH